MNLPYKFEIVSASKVFNPLGICFMKPETEYLIEKVERIGHRLIFHLITPNVRAHYQYLLPENYATVVSEEDIENINTQEV